MRNNCIYGTDGAAELKPYYISMFLILENANTDLASCEHMTYFGVNFYLTGLHSYASGDQVITPNFVWYSVAMAFALGAAALWKHLKYYKK